MAGNVSIYGGTPAPSIYGSGSGTGRNSNSTLQTLMLLEQLRKRNQSSSGSSTSGMAGLGSILDKLKTGGGSVGSSGGYDSGGDIGTYM